MVKKRGIVWNYFTKRVLGSQITAFCKFCDQSYIQNATRMEKHIERCVKCPDDVKQDFLTAVRNKRAKSMIAMKLADNWSLQPPQTEQTNTYSENLGNFKEWEYREDFNHPIPDNASNNSDTPETNNWNKVAKVETILQSDELTANRDWEANETSRENESIAAGNYKMVCF